MGLRALSGGRPKDIHHIIGRSPQATYLVIDEFIDFVYHAPELDIHLPQAAIEWSILNAQWKQKSTNDIIARYVGALDGFFNAQTNQQRKKLQTSYRTTLDNMSLMDSNAKL